MVLFVVQCLCMYGAAILGERPLRKPSSVQSEAVVMKDSGWPAENHPISSGGNGLMCRSCELSWTAMPKLYEMQMRCLNGKGLQCPTTVVRRMNLRNICDIFNYIFSHVKGTHGSEGRLKDSEMRCPL